MKISFSCRECGGGDRLFASEPVWARIAGFDSATAWFEDEAEPVPGSESGRVLRVRHPFLYSGDDPFWLYHEPPDARLDGFEEHPGALPGVRLVKCLPRALLEPAEEGVRRVDVSVVEVLTLDDLWGLDPAAGGDLPGASPASGDSSASSGEFFFMSANLEGDAGEWIICRKTAEAAAVLLQGVWGFHEGFVFAGKRPVSDKEFALLNRRFF